MTLISQELLKSSRTRIQCDPAERVSVSHNFPASHQIKISLLVLEVSFYAATSGWFDPISDDNGERLETKGAVLGGAKKT